jgi:hypothetical protein
MWAGLLRTEGHAYGLAFLDEPEGVLLGNEGCCSSGLHMVLLTRGAQGAANPYVMLPNFR